MTNPAYEKLVEEVAALLEHHECETQGDLARAALATVAKALETVTPEMVEARFAPIPAGLGPMTNEEVHIVMAQSNWSAMLAASALVKGD